MAGWLHAEINVRLHELNPETVAHLSTNRARRRLTSLIEANALTTTPDQQPSHERRQVTVTAAPLSVDQLRGTICAVQSSRCDTFKNKLKHFCSTLLWQKCSPKNLVFSDILFIVIFTEITENECVIHRRSHMSRCHYYTLLTHYYFQIQLQV